MMENKSSGLVDPNGAQCLRRKHEMETLAANVSLGNPNPNRRL